MKFSIIIPVYNVEKYIRKCLDSVLKQTYKNYEVIIVNDGTPDNSVEIINEYLSNDAFKLYNKENGGLSDARNFGVEKSTGDYIIFLDSDDYIESNLLKNLDIVLGNEKYDLVRYDTTLVDEEGNVLGSISSDIESGKISIKNLLSIKQSEIACAYAYNSEFFKGNNFKFEKGRIHEDYGLIPYILLKARSIYYMKEEEYDYVQRENSIVHGSEKAVKRCNDTLYHFDNLLNKINNDSSIDIDDKKIILSFLANGVILKCALLNGETLNDFSNKLKDRKVYKYLLDDTFTRKVKKFIVRLSPSLFAKLK